MDVVFPINAIAYHAGYGTFATGGGDGVVNTWDGNNKKRLSQARGAPLHVWTAFDAAAACMSIIVMLLHAFWLHPSQDALEPRPTCAPPCCLPAAPQVAGYPTSISSLAFSPSGATLAIAASYCFESGEAHDQPPDQIFLRHVSDADVKPKPRKAAA